MKQKSSAPTIKNSKAYHDYQILDTIQCGIVLRGNEIKSLRAGSGNFTGAWCEVRNGQLILHGMHIAKHTTANPFDVDEKRDRILLAHKREILKLSQKVIQDGITLIPLKLEWDRQYCKIIVGVCRGKHDYDKRESLKQRDAKRDMERASKTRW